MADRDDLRRLFDANWYLATYPDAAGLDPFEHFQRLGEAQGHDPNPLFSTRWYLARYRDVADSGGHALEDYVRRGVALGRDPGPLFSTKWYLRTVPELKRIRQNPLAYYLERGFRELYDPSPIFNSAWYFGAYPDAAGQGFDALLHFLHRGAALGYSPGPNFDLRWYLETYPEVAASGMNPLLHYLLQGAAKGFDPSADFSTIGFLESHPKVCASGDNPLVEYLYRHPNLRQTSGGTPGGRYARPSDAAAGEARDLIEAFSAVEPDLAVLPANLMDLKVTGFAPGAAELAWRKFYLSLHELPQTVLLIDSIDSTPDLTAVLDKTRDLLIVETDARIPSIAEALPLGTSWRSLSEFHSDINDEDRVRLTSALVNGLQPATVVIWGSRSAWDMLGYHGKALSQNARIFAMDRPVAGLDAMDMMRKHLRHVAPFLSGIFSHDPDPLREQAAAFGMSSKDRAKIGRGWTLSSLAGYPTPDTEPSA